MTSDHSLISKLAPAGKLRVSINLGNPLLANRNQATGMPEGISVDIAGLLAQRLGVEVDWVMVDTARASVEMVETEQADIGFFAIDPARATHISFTAAYVLIEGAYAVKTDSPIKANHQVDREGCQVVVGKGSAYDLFLTRELRSAKITRAPNSSSVVDAFLHQRADVAAGIRQQLEEEAMRIPGLRILAEPFMLIAQALGSHKRRGSAVQEHLSQFVEEIKSSGFISAALMRHDILGATVAAAA